MRQLSLIIVGCLMVFATSAMAGDLSIEINTGHSDRFMRDRAAYRQQCEQELRDRYYQHRADVRDYSNRIRAEERDARNRQIAYERDLAARARAEARDHGYVYYPQVVEAPVYEPAYCPPPVYYPRDCYRYDRRPSFNLEIGRRGFRLGIFHVRF